MSNIKLSDEEWSEVSQVLSFFSNVYHKEPNTEYCEILSSLFDSEWNFGFQSREGKIAYDNLQAIKEYDETDMIVEYNRLFVSAQPILTPPWASVYLNKNGEVFDDESVDVRNFYKKCGLEYENTLREPEDHMGLELMFSSYMAAQISELENVDDKLNFKLHLIDFLEIHLLPWCPYFFDIVAKKSTHDFYKNIAVLTNDYMQYLIKALSINPQERTIYDHYRP